MRELWRNSQTKALAYVQASTTFALAGMSTLDGIVNDQHFKDFLGNFTFPKYVIIGLGTISLLTWLAHGRSNADS